MSDHYPPGPKGHFLLGAIPEFMADPFEACKKAVTFGDVVHLRMLHKHAYLLNNPADVHHVLVEAADKYYKDQQSKTALKPWIGNGLFVNDGVSWRKQHKLVQPAFHHKRFQGYMDIVIQVTEAMLDGWTAGQQFDLKTIFTDITLPVVVKTLLAVLMTTLQLPSKLPPCALGAANASVGTAPLVARRATAAVAKNERKIFRISLLRFSECDWVEA